MILLNTLFVATINLCLNLINFFKINIDAQRKIIFVVMIIFKGNFLYECRGAACT